MANTEPINVVALISSLLAFVAICFGFLYFYISQHVLKKIETLEKDLMAREQEVKNVESKLEKIKQRLKAVEVKDLDSEGEHFCICKVAENTVASLVHLNEIVQEQHVMVLRSIIEDAAKHAYIEAHRKAFWPLNKHLQTLLLFSSEKKWRRSAMNQLSESLGEADTLAVLLKLKSHERDLHAEVEQAIEALQERLICSNPG